MQDQGISMRIHGRILRTLATHPPTEAVQGIGMRAARVGLRINAGFGQHGAIIGSGVSADVGYHTQATSSGPNWAVSRRCCWARPGAVLPYVRQRHAQREGHHRLQERLVCLEIQLPCIG